VEQDGIVGFKQFEAHFRCIFGIYMIGIFLIKKPHKIGMPNLVTGVTCTDHASVQPELFNKRYFPTAHITPAM